MQGRDVKLKYRGEINRGEKKKSPTKTLIIIRLFLDCLINFCHVFPVSAGCKMKLPQK